MKGAVSIVSHVKHARLQRERWLRDSVIDCVTGRRKTCDAIEHFLNLFFPLTVRRAPSWSARVHTFMHNLTQEKVTVNFWVYSLNRMR